MRGPTPQGACGLLGRLLEGWLEAANDVMDGPYDGKATATPAEEVWVICLGLWAGVWASLPPRSPSSPLGLRLGANATDPLGTEDEG